MIVWRIAKLHYAQSAEAMMSGDGARQAGGRWNSKGRRAVYAASTLSLAILEVLVHVPTPRVLRDFRMLEIDVPDDAILDLDSNAMNAAQMLTAGDRFLIDETALALRVASLVNPLEFNVVINPQHHEFSRVTWGSPRPFELDSRLA